jgi:acyl dehydratase
MAMQAKGELRTKAGYSISDLAGEIGREIGVSDWMSVDQRMIEGFAASTGDRQWIHVDVERAARESPFGGPVAHGFLTLALIPVLSDDIAVLPEGVKVVINYGLDRLRFLTPVKSGSRVRMRSKLLDVQQKAPDRFLVKIEQVIEIEGEEKPALIADTLSLYVFAEPQDFRGR